MFFLSKSLRYFMAVVQYSSITKAADSLCITPSPLSKHITMLETHIGFTLFIRGTSGLHLTERGKLLHQKLIPCYENILDIERELATTNINKVLPSELIIATNGSYSGYIPSFYNQLRTSGYNSRLSMCVLNEEDMANMLTDGNIHIYISSLKVESSLDVAHRTMRSEPIYLAVSPQLLSKYNNNVLDIMKNYPWAQPSQTFCQRNSLLLPYFTQIGINPDMIYLTDMHQRLTLVEQGLAISLVPASAQVEIMNKNIKTIETPGEQLIQSRHLYFLEENKTILNKPVSLLLECFNDWMANILGESVHKIV